jgi:hypothetical protein
MNACGQVGGGAGKPVDQFHILGKITGKFQAALREQNER